jgi:hydrogenase nickel insertion protein HypA
MSQGPNPDKNMHELGIAKTLIKAIKAESDKRPNTRITVVGLRLGELSGVGADELKFGIESLVKGTDLETLEIRIELAPRKHRCTDCGEVFEVAGDDTTCRGCGSTQTRIVSGDEIEISYLEVEE